MRVVVQQIFFGVIDCLTRLRCRTSLDNTDALPMAKQHHPICVICVGGSTLPKFSYSYTLLAASTVRICSAKVCLASSDPALQVP